MNIFFHLFISLNIPLDGDFTFLHPFLSPSRFTVVFSYPFTSIFHLISSTGAFIIHVVSKSVGFIEVREKKEKRLMIGS